MEVYGGHLTSPDQKATGKSMRPLSNPRATQILYYEDGKWEALFLYL